MKKVEAQEHSVYEEIRGLITQLEEQRVMPDENGYVYACLPLYEAESFEPRYEVDIIIKELF